MNRAALGGFGRRGAQAWVVSAFCLLTTMGLFGCVTTDEQTDWVPLKRSESHISFEAADKSGWEPEIYARHSDDYSRTIEHARWTASSTELDRATVIYVYLSPHHYFGGSFDFDDVIDYLPEFEGYELDRGEIITPPGRRGIIGSQLVYLDQITTCVIFTRFWGNDGFAPTNGGTRFFYGYYCMDPGDSFTGSDAREILSTLEIDSELPDGIPTNKEGPSLGARLQDNRRLSP